MQKNLSRRQARWSEFLQDYDFEICYRKGSCNGAADALSRRPGPENGGDDSDGQDVRQEANVCTRSTPTAWYDTRHRDFLRLYESALREDSDLDTAQTGGKTRKRDTQIRRPTLMEEAAEMDAGK